MKGITQFTVLVNLLVLGQAVIPSSSIQTAMAADSGPLITISTGQLRGSPTATGDASFKNIPFAQPPAGDLRWREPQPAKAS